MRSARVPHRLVAFAVDRAAAVGAAKTAAARGAELDAVAATDQLRTAVVDRPAVDRHKAKPARGAAAQPRRGDLGALDDKQRADRVVVFDLDPDILAKPAAILSVAARAFAQALVAEEDRVVALGDLDRGRGDVGRP